MISKHKIAVVVALAVSVLLATISTPVLAQEQTTVQVHSLDDSTFPVLTVVASVLDSNGRPIPGLTAADFDVLEDGSSGTDFDVQPIVNSDLGIAVVLAIDVSTSMAGTPLNSTKQATIAFIDSLSPSDQVAIVAFADTAQVVQSFTGDKEVAKQAVQRLQAVGRTALYDGAFRAVQVASETELTRSIVVLLSDANEFGGVSLTRRGDAFQEADEAGVPVYTIGLGSSVDFAYLEELAALTGGETYAAPSPAQLAGLYSEVSDLLGNQYVITVQSSVLADGQQHALIVRHVTSGSQASRTFASRAVAPQITVTGLALGQPLFERTSIAPQIASQGPLAEVNYLLDGLPIDSDPQPPYSVLIDPAMLAPGTHTLRIEARDSAGNIGQSNVIFDVAVLTPTASLPLLSAAEELGEVTVLEPNIFSQSPVTRVTYTIDGSPVHTTDQAPYAFTLNPSDLRRGEHTLSVVIENQAGQQGSNEFAFATGRRPFNLLAVGLGLAGFMLVIVLVLVLAGVVLVSRRREVVVAAPVAGKSGGAVMPTLAVDSLPIQADAWLKVDTGGDQRGETFELRRERIVIGRSPRCDVLLLDEQRFVSREHAAVWLQDARYMVEDLQSTRGTYVNGRRLEGPYRLENGDELHLGNYILIFQQLVYEEDEQLTLIEPYDSLVRDETDASISTDWLKESDRRKQDEARKSGKSGE